MRKARRTRLGQNRYAVLNHLIDMALHDDVVLDYLKADLRNKAFGRLLNSWMDEETRESVIDRYVDEEAKDVTGHALNIIAKRQRNEQTSTVTTEENVVTYNTNAKQLIINIAA